MSRVLPSATVNKAKRLVESDAHKGNHGFKDMQLAAWRYQRKTILAALRVVARGKRIDYEDYNEALNATCPRFAGKRASFGTQAGSAWVNRSVSLLSGCYEFSGRGDP